MHGYGEDIPHLHTSGAPSPLREEIGWLWRNLHGVGKTNSCGIRPLPQETVLNSIHLRINLGFVGDIMAMGRKVLRIAPDVRLFFQDCDYLIGNMEGTITGAGKPSLAAQCHDPSILIALAGLFPPDRTFLSVANNPMRETSRQPFSAIRSTACRKADSMLSACGRRLSPI